MKNKFRTIRGSLLILLSFIAAIGGPIEMVLAQEAFDRDFYANNDILYYDPRADSCQPAASGAGAMVRGTGNILKIYNFLIQKGLSDIQAAGLLGNIQQESGFSAFRQEDIHRHNYNNGGYGIVQWTNPGRRTAIVGLLREKHPEIMDKYFKHPYGLATKPENGYVPEGISEEDNDKVLAVQLEFLYQEATTRKVRSGYGPAGATEWDAMKAAQTLKQASDVWLFSFERPADQSPAHAQRRASYGQAILDGIKQTASAPSAQPGSTTSDPDPLGDGGAVPTIQTPTTTAPSGSNLTGSVPGYPAAPIVNEDVPSPAGKGPAIKYFKPDWPSGKLKTIGTYGATTFGGVYRGGKWVANNDVQGNSGLRFDDDGIAGGAGIAGTASFAELSSVGLDFSAMGNLPKGYKVKVTNPKNNKSMILEKRDVGRGQSGKLSSSGKPHVIDLWWEAAAALDFKDGSGELILEDVADQTTPRTALNGAQLSGTGDASTSVCTCTEDTASNSSAVDVVLDPGHTTVDKQGKEVDEQTKLFIGDSSNSPENRQMWDTAQKIKSILESKGYSVKLTRNTFEEYTNFRQRADVANSSNAKIAVSLHNTPGTYGGAVSWVTPQKVGGYRTSQDGNKISFTKEDVAKKSQEYAAKIVTARKQHEPGTVLHDLNFDARDGLSPGNLPVVQLLSNIPWVYNEAGQTGFNMDTYADGVATGIMNSIYPGGSSGSQLTTPLQTTPPQTPDTGERQFEYDNQQSGENPDAADNVTPGGTTPPPVASTQSNCTTKPSDLSGFVLSYAWPEYHPKPYTNKKPEYEEAVKNARSNGEYTGGTCYGGGVDCGAFVSILLKNSGFEPGYNYENVLKNGASNTVYGQEPWMKKNWQLLGTGSTIDAGTLQPGDVAINDTHTFVFVGQIPGFGSTIASASLCGRAPMAGKENITGNFRWYRKKV